MTKIVPVVMVNENNKATIEIFPKRENTDPGEIREGEESEKEKPDLKFKIKLENAMPKGVKVSKKNTCIVNIMQSKKEANNAVSEEKLLQYLIDSKEPSWTQQFKNAV
jgi:hypothetical protein